jgi:hypothetical protein
MMRNTSALCLLLLGGCAAAHETLPRPGVLRPRAVQHVNGTVEPVSFKVNTIRSLGVGARTPCETNDRMPVGTVAPEQVPPMPRATSPGTSVPIPNACAVTHGAPGLEGSVPGVLRKGQPVQAPPKELQP